MCVCNVLCNGARRVVYIEYIDTYMYSLYLRAAGCIKKADQCKPGRVEQRQGGTVRTFHTFHTGMYSSTM